MPQRITFEVKGPIFTFDRVTIFLDDMEVSFQQMFQFIRGTVDLRPQPTIVDAVPDVSSP